jgi:hypothetical protein
MKTIITGAAIGLAAIAAVATVANAGSGRSGIETITGSSSNPNIVAIHASGVFTANGTFKPPSENKKGTVVHFVFRNGTLTAVAGAPVNGPMHLNHGTCAGSASTYIAYAISPGKSTGAYAGATGHGTATLTFSAVFPRLPSGACNFSSNAAPKPGTAHESFVVKGPLTLR